MPRNYVRKTTRSTWTEEALIRAVRAIKENKCSIRKAAKLFNVPYATLHDRLNNRYPSEKIKLGRKSVFSQEQEAELRDYILKLANMYYGLTPKKIKQIAYDFAVSNNVKHNFNCEKKMCGKEWLYGFLRRNQQISLRRPEATSLNRVLAFNRTDVNLFYDNLEQVMEKYQFLPQRIFNVDETGITGVHKPSRILAQKGRKQVGSVTSGERGQTTTIVCCMSASGLYIPPMFIFKRGRMKEGLDRNGPIGSVYRCSMSGWITEDLFLEWLRHFASFIKASKQDPVLLILDNHCTHSSLTSYDFCRDNGIVVVSLPPHTSHRLQPLDVTFFSSLKAVYNQECDQYMKSNHFEKISITNIAELFANAYNRVTTTGKGVKGFQITGICPLNRNVFEEEEFVNTIQENNKTATDMQDNFIQEIISGPSGICREVTAEKDVNLNNISGKNSSRARMASSSDESVENVATNLQDNFFQEAIPGPSGICREVTPDKSVNANKIPPKKSLRARKASSSSDESDSQIVAVFDPEATDDEDKTIQLKNKTFEDIYAIPLTKKLRSTGRTKQHSKILTSTPVKEELEEKELKKRKKNIQIVKKKITNGKVNKQKTLPKYKKNDNVCPVCCDFGKNELWWRCRGCAIWSHAACTEFERAEDFSNCIKCEKM